MPPCSFVRGGGGSLASVDKIFNNSSSGSASLVAMLKERLQQGARAMNERHHRHGVGRPKSHSQMSLTTNGH